VKQVTMAVVDQSEWILTFETMHLFIVTRKLNEDVLLLVLAVSIILF